MSLIQIWSRYPGLHLRICNLVIILVALAVVGAARYYLIREQIQLAVTLGQVPPNVVMAVASLLGGNLLCYFLGAGFTYALHDPNPDYEDAAREAKQTNRQVMKLRRKKFDKDLAGINKRIKSDREKIQRVVSNLKGMPEYAEVLKSFSEISSKDLEVISILQKYRKRLANEMSEQNAGAFNRLNIFMPDFGGDPLRTSKSITFDEFSAGSVTMHYGDALRGVE